MENWKKPVLLAASSLLLAACGAQAQEENVDTTVQTDTTTQVDTSVEVSEKNGQEEQYRAMLNQAKEEYEAGLLDAAGGTIAMLLENDLSAYSELEEESVSLQEEIKAAQAEEARAQLEEQPEATEYGVERQSELAAEEFNKATGNEIQSASDEEIGTWLSEKEQAEAEQVSEASPEEIESEEDAADSLLQEQETVLEAVIKKLDLNPEGYEFFLVKSDEAVYQVEIRQPHAVDEVEVSNMIGIFEYEMETEALKKLNPITGEWEEYTAAVD